MKSNTGHITVREVTTRKEILNFIHFNYRLYKDNKYSVPEMSLDLLNTFSKVKNPAFDFCEAKFFLAFNSRDEVVGRVAGIINHKANETWNTKYVRFGWIDFVDDPAVSEALLSEVEKWGKEKGMNRIQGPMGFSDLDHEGMLVYGFDEVSTSATIYNYLYYPQHLEQFGYEKEVDWIEMSIKIPDTFPEKFGRIADIVKKKYELHVAPRNVSMKSYLAKYGKSFFDCVNAAFKPLFGYSELTDRQIQCYLDMYSDVLDMELISLVLDKDEKVVACGVAMPSMSEALQKSGGKMLPFGWWYLLKALKWKRSQTADLLLAAVLPEYQGKGINAIFMYDIYQNLLKGGYKMLETNVELESNTKIQSQWDYFERRIHKRRRCYHKAL